MPDELADTVRQSLTDDEASVPTEAGARTFGHSKDSPRGPAAGGHRDGGHPRRDADPVLDLPR